MREFSHIGCDHDKKAVGTDATFEVGAETPLGQNILEGQSDQIYLRISGCPSPHHLSRLGAEVILILQVDC